MAYLEAPGGISVPYAILCYQGFPQIVLGSSSIAADQISPDMPEEFVGRCFFNIRTWNVSGSNAPVGRVADPFCALVLPSSAELYLTRNKAG